ncbi:MAG TPA: DNA primase [Candidatus Paceibacterota bacterium]|nr:DNA primase [Candidatus Paceibacterota bacterium]
MSQVDEIKERLNIVDVVSSYVKLQKAGRNYKGLSPFTKENTPSFFVSPDKGMYYCFSTNKGGDIFTFIEEVERVDFMGALKILADKAGMTLQMESFSRSKQKQGARERLYAVLEKVAFSYQKNLAQNKEVFRYLLGRGVKTETLKTFRVGFAIDAWDDALRKLQNAGFSEQEIEGAGLIIPRTSGSRGFYDRFRGRIMFPVCDTAGRVVGFSGRIFEAEKKTASHSENKSGQPVAKYVNTPETELYHKSSVLYGFDKAKETIRTEDACILVEGQMDVLASFEAGVKNVVAVSGTSLTIEHLKIIGRFTNNLIIALDADTAGEKASDRSAKMALSLGMNVSALAIEKGKDASDLVQRDPALWKTAVSGAREYLDLRIATLAQKTKPADLPGKMQEIIFPHVFAIESSMKKDEALKKISVAAGVSLEAVREEFKAWAKTASHESFEEEHRSSPVPEKATVFSSGTRKDGLRKRLTGIFLWQESEKNPLPLLETFKKQYLDLEAELVSEGEKKEGTPDRLSEDEQNALSFEAEIFYHGNEHLEKEIRELLLFFEIEIINEKLAELLRELRKQETAPHAGDGAEKLTHTERLMEEYQTLSKRKEALQESLK